MSSESSLPPIINQRRDLLQLGFPVLILTRSYRLASMIAYAALFLLGTVHGVGKPRQMQFGWNASKEEQGGKKRSVTCDPHHEAVSHYIQICKRISPGVSVSSNVCKTISLVGYTHDPLLMNLPKAPGG